MTINHNTSVTEQFLIHPYIDSYCSYRTRNSRYLRVLEDENIFTQKPTDISTMSAFTLVLHSTTLSSSLPLERVLLLVEELLSMSSP